MLKLLSPKSLVSLACGWQISSGSYVLRTVLDGDDTCCQNAVRCEQFLDSYCIPHEVFCPDSQMVDRTQSRNQNLFLDSLLGVSDVSPGDLVLLGLAHR